MLSLLLCEQIAKIPCGTFKHAPGMFGQNVTPLGFGYTLHTKTHANRNSERGDGAIVGFVMLGDARARKHCVRWTFP